MVIALVLGVALGNLLRGVPLDESGYFSAPLFTDFRVGPHPGALDWYTLLVGGFTLAVLTGHGALYLRWKTSDALQARATRIARLSWLVILLLGIVTTIATAWVRPPLYRRLLERPWTWSFAALIAGGAAMVLMGLRRPRELLAFLGSALFIAAL